MVIVKENVVSGSKVQVYGNATMIEWLSIVKRAMGKAIDVNAIVFSGATSFEVKTKCGKHLRFMGV